MADMQNVCGLTVPAYTQHLRNFARIRLAPQFTFQIHLTQEPADFSTIFLVFRPHHRMCQELLDGKHAAGRTSRKSNGAFFFGTQVAEQKSTIAQAEQKQTRWLRIR